MVAASPEARATAEKFAALIRPATGYELTVTTSATDRNAIEFVLDPDLSGLPNGAEGYQLEVSEERVLITAPTQIGLYYGAQTLAQLLGPWVRSAQPVQQTWLVPAVTISDGPRYGYRGFMLDMSRSFMPVDEVKQIIDELAAHKLNVLHLHLSDDQGWRIAISNQGRAEGDDIDYTLLTTRSGATAVTKSQWTDLPGRTGFYTADDFADIISYADARHIAVVPEIDGPAHANAALHAIEQLNSEGSYPALKEGETTAPPIVNTSVGDSSLDANNPATYTFLRHVLRQLVEANSTLVHGERYLHIGGDESFNTSDEAFRTYMDNASQIVSDLDAIPMAWKEAFNKAGDKMPDGSIIHHWVGDVSATARNLIATRGMKLTMSPASHAYLPQRPGVDIIGPSWACGGTGGACGINAFYNWDPSTLAGVDDAGILGVTAPIWSEHIRSLNSMEYLLYPRLMATVEVGWTPHSERQINDFRTRVTTLGTALTVSGRNFYPGDGTWELDVRGAVLPELAHDEAPGLVGWASLPGATGVTAELQIGDEKIALEATASREYLDGAGQDFDHRQVNSIFELRADTPPCPAGSTHRFLDRNRRTPLAH